MIFELLEKRDLLTASLVADYNTSPAGISLSFEAPVPFQDQLFLSVTTQQYGQEIWKTDGTTEGTKLLKDIAPGNEHSAILSRQSYGLVEYEDNLYFVASDGESTALYRSDGTSEGTHPFFTLPTSNVSPLVEFDGQLFFLSQSHIGTKSLWSTDGTTAGTKLSMDANSAHELLVVGDALVIIGRTEDYQHGAITILDSDGTTTQQQFTTGTDEFTPVVSARVAFEDQLSVVTSEGLWFTDLKNEPRLVADRTSISNRSVVEANTALYFAMLDNVGASDLPEYDVQLWMTDGVSETVLASNQEAWPIGVLEDKLHFATYVDDRTQLWATNGTPDSEVVVFESNGILDIDSTLAMRDSADGDAIYASMRADATSHNASYELWELKESSSQLVATFADRSSAIGRVGDKVLLLADDGTHGAQFWSYDTLTSELDRLNVATPNTDDSQLEVLGVAGDRLYFNSSTNWSRSLWAFDGIQRTRSARLPTSFGPQSAHPFGDQFLVNVSASTDISARELWIWDGNLEPARKLFSFEDRSIGRQSEGIAAGENYFLVLEDDIWVTDGSPEGSQNLRKFAPQIGEDWKIRGDVPTPTLGDEILFVVTDPTDISQLWSTNGTEAGTKMVHQFSNIDFVFDSALTATDRFVYFRTMDSSGRQTVERTDGTFPNTMEIVITESLDPSQFIKSLVSTNGGVFVTLGGGFSDEVLFFDESTGISTPILSDLPRGERVQQTTVVDDQLFFTIKATRSGEVPNEDHYLWRSNGTVDGTKRIHRLHPNRNLPLEVAKAGSTYYFTAEDESTGIELWGTDGSTEGTFQYDINPGSWSSNPQGLTSFRDELYFTAETNPFGRELWNVAGPPPAVGDLNQDGDVGFADFLTLSRHVGTEATRSEGDINGDGFVDFADFRILSENFGARQERPVSFTPLIPIFVDLVAEDDPFDEDEEQFEIPILFPFIF